MNHLSCDSFLFKISPRTVKFNEICCLHTVLSLHLSWFFFSRIFSVWTVINLNALDAFEQNIGWYGQWSNTTKSVLYFSLFFRCMNLTYEVYVSKFIRYSRASLHTNNVLNEARYKQVVGTRISRTSIKINFTQVLWSV